MGDQEFERYLALLAGMLKLSRRQKESIASELRDHLEERLAELKEAGVDDDQAVREALEEFGDIASLATEFAGVQGTLRRRSIMRFTAGMGAVGIAAVMMTIFWPVSPVIREAGAQAPVVAATGAATTDAADADDARTAEAYRALTKAVTVDVKDKKLSEVLASLGEQMGVGLEVNRASMETAGLDPDELVSLQLSKVSGETALRMLLETRDLTFVIAEGDLVVLSQQLAAESLVTRVYPVADLANSDEVHPGAFGGSSPATLIEVLTSVVAPSEWEASGGLGTIQNFQGTLIISQTEAVHQKITPVLEELRRVSQVPPGREAVPATSPVAKAMAKTGVWKIDEMPLEQAVAQISKELGVPVLLDKRALEQQGIPLEVKISLNPGNVTARKAMDLFLMGNEWGLVDIGGEALLLTSKYKAENALEVRLHNIRDLLTLPGVEPVDESDLDYDSVVSLVTSSVKPQSWDTVGGQASAQCFRGMLVIAQTRPLHERVTDLLARVRGARERQKLPVVAKNPEELDVRVYPLSHDTLVVAPSAVVAGAESVKGAEGKDPAKDLMLILEQLVEPKSWQSAGGKGQIYVMPTLQGISLVVKQKPAVHKEVRRLLRTIEREVAKKSSAGFFQ